MCGWTNPGRADSMDELNWERLEARGEPRFPQVRDQLRSKSRFILIEFIRRIILLGIVRATISAYQGTLFNNLEIGVC